MRPALQTTSGFVLLALLASQPAARSAGAQAPASEPILRGVVVDSGGLPLPFVTVRVESPERTVLTDAAGRFAIGGAAAGPRSVLVRHVGFVPWRGVLTAAHVPGAGPDTIRLARLVMRLAAVVVRPGQACTAGGLAAGPDSAALAPLLTQLRLNGERLRLVVGGDSVVRRYHRIREYVDGAETVVARRIDTVVAPRVEAVRPYAPGRVAYRVSRRAWNLAFPTPDVVGEDAFVRAHCFQYAGVDSAAGRAVYRVDFSAVEGLGGPDVSGTLWLDAATLELRAATFRLAHAPGDLPDMEVESRYSAAGDGRPVVAAMELRYRQRRTARVDGRDFVRTVERQTLLP